MVKKIVWILVGAIVFATVGLVVFVGLWDRDVKSELMASASEIPLDWRQQILSFSTIPSELRSFRPDSVVDGNAADFLLREDLSGRVAEYDRVYRLVSSGTAVSEGDSSVFGAVLADSLLDTAITVSRMSSYNSVSIIDDATQDRGVLGVIPPDLIPAGRIVSSLLLRSFSHGRNGVTDSAVVDVAAALRLSEMIYEQGSTLVETIVGRRLIERSVRQMAAIGVATEDSALAARSRTIEQWASGERSFDSLIRALGMDRAATLEIVRDADVLASWRAEAISQLVFMEFRPKNVPLGISGAVRSEIANLSQLADPRVAWMAGRASATVNGFNALGIGGRVNFLRGLN